MISMTSKMDKTGERKARKRNQTIQHLQGYEILNSDPLFHPAHIKKGILGWKDSYMRL